jgi:hypothetical protein
VTCCDWRVTWAGNRSQPAATHSDQHPSPGGSSQQHQHQQQQDEGLDYKPEMDVKPMLAMPGGDFKGPTFDFTSASSGSTDDVNGGEVGLGMEGDTLHLWGHEWRREVTREGKSLLTTTLESEGQYDDFMKRFSAEDLQEVRCGRQS